MSFYGYTECNDEMGFLETFSVVLADTDLQNRVKLGPIGAEVADKVCAGYTFPSPIIYRASIFGDSERIYGVRFYSGLGFTEIGSNYGLERS